MVGNGELDSFILFLWIAGIIPRPGGLEHGTSVPHQLLTRTADNSAFKRYTPGNWNVRGEPVGSGREAGGSVPLPFYFADTDGVAGGYAGFLQCSDHARPDQAIVELDVGCPVVGVNHDGHSLG